MICAMLQYLVYGKWVRMKDGVFLHLVYQYPPLVRKIRKVKKKITKDKKIKPTSTLNRELLVAKNLQEKINFADYEQAPMKEK